MATTSRVTPTTLPTVAPIIVGAWLASLSPPSLPAPALPLTSPPPVPVGDGGGVTVTVPDAADTAPLSAATAAGHSSAPSAADVSAVPLATTSTAQ